jgi:hypothetical protein
MKNGRFLSDVTVPDGSLMEAGERFTKRWRLQNSGDEAWVGSDWLAFVGGHPLGTRLRFPLTSVAAGESHDLAVDLTAPDCPGFYRSYWRLQDDAGTYFGDMLFVEIEVVRQRPTWSHLAPEAWRRTIFAITSVFETGTAEGNPAAYQTYDAGIISYGRHQATLSSGNLGRVVQAYVQRSDSPTSQALQQEYLHRLLNNDRGLREDGRLRQLLITAASEPAMHEAQEMIFAQNFYQPSIESAHQYRLQTPLGLACLYDTRIQGGLDIVANRTRDRLGGLPGHIGKDSNPIREADWLLVFLDEREIRLLRLANQSAARGDQVNANALRVSTFRVEELRKLLLAGNLDLAGELVVRGQRIGGITAV